ncbi:4a-hydroxytetrahydrobiopterin dehydratase [Amycolatopsis sp. cg5]|uniref:4a-hydroxytetrahydrobiopterin dehydratase n=1 Tax=Amycolatopsis sp. cg5 TaxID=3238802 RepID=UPI003526A9A0
MAELLSDSEVDQALAKLPEWRRDGDSIGRKAQLASFVQAIEVVDRVADLAEAADHHPDIDIRWRTLLFRLSTHSAGGLTEKDFQLAGQIEELLATAG